MKVTYYLKDLDGEVIEQEEILPEGYDSEEVIEDLMYTWLESQLSYNHGLWEEYGVRK